MEFFLQFIKRRIPILILIVTLNRIKVVQSLKVALPNKKKHTTRKM